MSAPTSPADLVILGGGSGGYAAAFRASELGLNVVLIEKDKVGGTCLHRGCIPTKALLHAGEVADLAREGEQFGVKTSLAGIDMDGVNAYKDGVIAKLYKGLQGLVKARKITYVEGEGRLTSPTTVEVNGQSYEGRHILLATGSYARSLPGLDIDGTRSSPATTPSRWTGCPPRRSSSAAASSAASSPARGSPSASTSPSSRRSPTWCRWRTRPPPSCSSARSAAARSPSSSAAGSPASSPPRTA